MLLQGLLLLNTFFTRAAGQSTGGVALSALTWEGAGCEHHQGWQHITRHSGNIAGAELECALPGSATDWQGDGLTNLMNLGHPSPGNPVTFSPGK